MAQGIDIGPAADGVARIAELEVEVEHLRRALLSRDVIGQAKGIMMERFKVTPDEAFGLLVKSSQHRNVRVADLAVELAETGDWSGPLPQE
jgi:AmiR/NasT family two-component response regulator